MGAGRDDSIQGRSLGEWEGSRGLYNGEGKLGSQREREYFRLGREIQAGGGFGTGKES